MLRYPTISVLFFVTLALGPRGALGAVEGTAPSKVGNWRLFGQHSATGATLMAPGPVRAEINSVLLTSATAQVSDVPYDGVVTAAFLFWSGATPRSSRSGAPDGPDFDLDLMMPGGTSHNGLSVLTDTSGFARCETTDMYGGFYYCRIDISQQVIDLGPGNANGIYTVSGVDADVGISPLDPRWPGDPQVPNAQAKYAGWSMVLVWSSSTINVRRDVVLYDGFLRLDEDRFTLGQHRFTVDGFVVGSPALGRISVFGLEGDGQLGVPPQDSTGCPTCFDYISFQGERAATATKLSDGANPPNNSFNSSWNGQSSIDIDTYNLDGILTTGETTAEVVLSSGDGTLGGNGESFFGGWVIMTLDTLTPNFAGTSTTISVTPTQAAAGQVLYYTVDVVNEGSLAATNVVVQAAIPANTTYLSSSTVVDGVPVADVGANSPVAAGLNVGNIDTVIAGDNSKRVVFAVVVDLGACGGSVSASASVSSSQTEAETVGPAIATIEAASLDIPTKRVTLIPPGPTGPGSSLWYTISLHNNSARDAGGLSISDSLPPEIAVQGVLTGGAWSLDNGQLDVSDLIVPAGNTVDVVLIARVLSVAELAAKGIAETEINGRPVLNQATVSSGCGPDMLTDDPLLPGSGDETVFSLVYAPVLTTSTKTVSDANGVPLEPNDVLTYSINIVNTGNRVADIIATDAVPANTAYVAGSTRLDGVPVPDVAGAAPLASGLNLNGVPYVGDNDRLITFEVRVDALATNGTVVSNSAALDVPADPSANIVVVAPDLAVFAEPRFDTSRKSFVARAAYKPGEQVEYTVTVENSGNRPGSNIVVTDALASELAFVSADNGGAHSAGVVTWNLGSLAAGQSVDLKVVAQLNSPLNNGIRVSNQATIDSDESAPFTTPPVEFVVTSGTALVLTKVDEHASVPIAPGDAVTYRMLLSNVGDAEARDIVVTDTIDPSLQSLSAPSGRITGSTVTWDGTSHPELLSMLPGAAAVELVFSAVISAPLVDGTAISNQAVATAAGGVTVVSDDPDTAAALDPTTFQISSSANLLFSKRVEDLSPSTPTIPGDRVRYTLELQASGSAPVRDVVVTDVLDGALTLVDVGMDGGQVVAGLPTWSPATGALALSVLNPGDVVTLQFEATVAATTADGMVVRNQAQALSLDVGSVLSDGNAAVVGAQTTDFVVASRPSLWATKTVTLEGDDDPAFNPGDLLRYAIHIENQGSVAVTNIEVVDVIDRNLVLVDVGTGSAAGTALIWRASQLPVLASLAPGTSVDLTFTARIVLPLDDGTSISNQASISSPMLAQALLSDDPEQPGVEDPTVVVVGAAPVLSEVTKSVADLSDDALVTRPGDRLLYTLQVRNTGDASAHNVVVRDPIPAQVSVVSTPGARLEGADIVWDASTEPLLSLLTPGESVTLTFEVDVRGSLANGTQVSNQALVSSDEISTGEVSDDPATVAIDDSTTLTVNSASDLGGTTKTVTDSNGVPITEASPNDMIRYYIHLSNRGDAPATNVAITDLLPTDLSIVDAAGAMIAGQSLTWNASTTPELASIAAGGTVDLIIQAQLIGTFSEGQVISNQASVTSAESAAPILTDADDATLPKEETLLTVRVESNLAAPTKVFEDPFAAAVITQASPGDVVRSTIEIRNLGDGMSAPVMVTDVLAVDRLVSIVVRDGGVLVGDTVTWAIPGLNPGETRQLRVDASIRIPADPTPLVTQATVTVEGGTTTLTDDPGLPGSEDETVLTIVANPDFAASTKDVVDHDDRTVGPGDVVRYTLTLNNAGNGNAIDTAVTDSLDANLTFVSADSGGTYDAATRQVTWSIPRVEGQGGEATVTVDARVAAGLANGVEITNQAVVDAGGIYEELSDDPTVATPDTPTKLTVVSAPSLTGFTKTFTNTDEIAAGRIQPGDQLEFTLSFTNEGNAPATDVVLRDPVDTAGFNRFGPRGSFRRQGDVLVWNSTVLPTLASVAAGETVSIVFVATVAPGVDNGTTLVNTATVDAVELDEAQTTSVDIPVAYPQIIITKVGTDVNGGTLEPGDAVTFVITVENSGAFLAERVLVGDAMPDLLTDVTATPPPVSFGNILGWSFRSLNPAERQTISIEAVVSSTAAHGDQIINTATARAQGLAAERSEPVTFVVDARPRFSTSIKSIVDAPDFVGPGDEIEYVIDVVNDGAGSASRLHVVDLVDPWLEIIGVDGPAVIAEQEIVWSFTEFAIDQRETLTIRTQVRPGTPNNTQIFNHASFLAPELDADEETAPVGVIVSAEPRFEETTLMVRDMDGGVVLPGDILEYELRVKNTGALDATEVRASLPPPAFTTYVDSSLTLNGVAVPDAAGAATLTDLSVRSARQGTAEGVVWRDDGDELRDEEAVVVFRLVVHPDAVVGTMLAMQGVMTGAAVSPTASDDPRTGDIYGDATVVVVGGGGVLSVVKEALRDDGAAIGVGEVAPVGSVIRYRMTLSNSGDSALRGLIFEDRVSDRLQYAPASMRLEGIPLTDIADGDAGQVDGRWLTIELPEVTPGASVVVEFAAGVLAGPSVSNQAVVKGDGRTWLSDGDPATPGAQTTNTPVEADASLLSVFLEGYDVDGGTLLAGDVVRFAMTLSNDGVGAVDEINMALTRSELFVNGRIVGSGEDLAVADDPPEWKIPRLEVSARQRVEYEVEVAVDAPAGEVMRAFGVAVADSEEFRSESVTMLVGGAAGTGSVGGRLFWDRGSRDGQFDATEDALLDGFSMLLLPAAQLEALEDGDVLARDIALQEAFAEEQDATFAMAGVPPGQYRLWAVSPDDVQYAESETFTVEADAPSRDHDFAIDPSGIIYQELQGVAHPVADARVFLVDIDDISGGERGTDVPVDAVFGGQQGQRVSAQGFYRFDVRGSALPGRFRIRVEPAAPTFLFPSELRQPAGATEVEADGAFAVVGPDGRVVPEDFPDLDGDTTYFLLFDLSASSVDITNNHIPVDRADQRIRLTKRADRRTATIGEIVTYTVTITNPTDISISGDDGGVVLVDNLPPGIKVATHKEGGGRRVKAWHTVTQEVLVNAGQLRSQKITDRRVEFEPLPLRAHSTTVIRYYGVVGIEAKGMQENRAHLTWLGQAITNEGSASVRVRSDPVFDEGTVLGRVHCGATSQDDEEAGGVVPTVGVPGARVYLDTGYYADTDIDGKFHFRAIPAGRHALKLDVNTLLPGYNTKSDVLRQFHTTRGILSKIDFIVECNLARVSPTMKESGPRPAVPTGKQAGIVVDAALPAISLNGAPQALPIVDAVLLPADVTPDFKSGAGLTVAGQADLVWHVQRPTRMPFESWQISLFSGSGTEFWRVEGQGRPPARIPWDLGDELKHFEGGSQLFYRIVAKTRFGDLGEGRWRTLRLGVKGKSSAGEALATWRGELFGKREAPTADLKKRVSSLLTQLREQGPIPSLRIEVHTYSGGKRSARLLTTQRRAVAVAKLFMEAGISLESLQAIGMGDSVPLLPAEDPGAKVSNRRVLIKPVLPQASTAAAPALAYEPIAILNGQQQELDDERLEKIIAVKTGERVSVEARKRDGGRVHIARDFPFAASKGGEGGDVSVEVEGSLNDGTLVIGGDTALMALMTSGCRAKEEQLPMDGDRLGKPADFSLTSNAAISSWLIRVFNPSGTVLTDISGIGAPSGVVPWSGTSPQGLSVVHAGAYSYRCMFSDVDGNRSVSALRPLSLGAQDAMSEGGNTEVVLADERYPSEGGITGAAADALATVAAVHLKRPGSATEIRIHDGAEGGKMQAQIRTARLAATIQSYLDKAGLPPGAIKVLARGALEPVMPGTSRHALRRNRRITIRTAAPVPQISGAAPGEEQPARKHVRINGELMTLTEDMRFSGSLTVASDATLTVDLLASDGRSALYSVPLYEGRIVDAESTIVPKGSVPAADSPAMGSLPHSILSQSENDAPLAQAGATNPVIPAKAGIQEDATGKGLLDPRVRGDDVEHKPETAALLPVGDNPVIPAKAGIQEDASGKGLLDPRVRGDDIEHNPDAVVPPADAFAQDRRQAIPVPTLVAAPEGLASNIEVLLPPSGTTLRGERFTVAGRTLPANRVRINGQVVRLDSLGRFAHTIVLPVGKAAIEVISEDQEGHVAHIRRDYWVPQAEWFVLALGEAAAGVGPALEGSNADTTKRFGDDFYLHGRAVGYIKGRIRGDALWEALKVDNVRVTAHVDTGKQNDPNTLRQLIDPDAYYPVYGDTAEEVQDVSSRWKLYVLLEADRSRLRVGNFKVALRGGELFRYQRSHFGAALDIDHDVAPGHRTEVHAFVARGDAGIAHRQLLFQGTGGSMYFMRDAAIVEGSERVKIVVLDDVTGARLLEVPRTRDVDYTVNYRDGHVIFMDPIPSSVLSGWRLNHSATRTLEGHSVMVDVQYDYEVIAGDAQGGALAFQARHTINERYSVGAGVVDEEKGDGSGLHYRLYGAQAEARLLERTVVRGELAFSEQVDGDHLASFDGGITFGALGTPYASAPGVRGGVAPQDDNGWAGRLQLSGDIGEYLGINAGARGAPVAPYVAYLQHQTPGFYAGSAIVGQGQSKIGLQARTMLSPRDSIRLRHDGVWSWLFLQDEDRRVLRQITTLGYEHNTGNWLAGAEVGNNYAHDGVRAGDLGTLTAYGEKNLIPGLRGTMEHQVTVADTAGVMTGAADRMTTTLGLRYRLGKSLWLTGVESLRWSGTNSTQIGLKTKIEDTLSLYASERLTAGSGRTVTTTVVGGESTAIPGSRSFAEYRVDNLMSAETGRVVFGMDNKWSVLEGVQLHLSYQRSQLVGGPKTSTTGSAITDPGVTGNGTGPLTRQSQFAASGYSSGTVFPAGVSSRDALSVGLQVLRTNKLKSGLRFEMRYDKGDRVLGAPDRMVLFSQAGIEYRFNAHLIALSRIRAGSVRNLDPNLDGNTNDSVLESQFLDVSTGVALRPDDHDRWGGLFKWTRRYERMRTRLDLQHYQLQVADVIALEPWVELGYGVQLVGKLALKLFEVLDAELPTTRSTTTLSIVRVNYHLTEMFDAGVEYRWLGNALTQESQHGALIEFAWLPVEHVSAGVGYNFSHFSDDLLAAPNTQAHGFFLRVTGRY